MKNIIWRNQASGVLGVLIVILTIFSGLPETIEQILFISLGSLIIIFGFTTSYTLKKRIKQQADFSNQADYKLKAVEDDVYQKEDDESPLNQDIDNSND